jgi:hypothetical protein
MLAHGTMDLGQDDGPALRRVEPRPLHAVHHLAGEALHLCLERLVVGAELDAGDEVQPQREASAAASKFFQFIFMKISLCLFGPSVERPPLLK